MNHVIDVIAAEAARMEAEYEGKLRRQRELLKQSADIRINNSSSEAMWESSGELRTFEQDLTIKSNELNQAESRMAVLEKMKEEPYFGRIDYHESRKKEDEQIYIGIGSLFEEDENLVVDWRAPIASLYYEGNVGDQVKLRFGHELNVFEVDLKRQFRVKEGHIVGMIDTDNVMGDPYLLEVLEGNSSSHMGAVVATLQREQNQIVRETGPRYVLIEGVAGSGKTVVLMQKIAFLLYTFKKQLKHNEILLFSPNRIFQEYISQVLPSLGEWNVEGRTYPQFIQQRVSALDLRPPKTEETSRFATLKGSLDFYRALKQYANLLKKRYLKFGDLSLRAGEALLSSEEIEEIYQGINSKGSLAGKLEILKSELLNRLEVLKQESLHAEWVDEELQHLSESSLVSFEKLSHNLTKLEEEMRREIVTKAFQPVVKRVENQSFLRYKNQYVHFLRVVPQLMDLDKFAISREDWQDHLSDVVGMMQEKELSLEDMTAYYALFLEMKGILKQKDYQYICIDEVQDFSAFQLQLLKDLYPRARYVMAGDLNQNIWHNQLSMEELAQIFPEEDLQQHHLRTSYRSTKEIMAFADQFAQWPERAAEPIRRGEKPELLSAAYHDFKQTLERYVKGALEKEQRVAFLAPSVEAARSFEPVLDSLDIPYAKVYEDADSLNRPVVLMPVSLAKGLEFDVVFAIDGSDAAAPAKQRDNQIWYTIFSRAMHKLYLIVPNLNSSLLNGVAPETYAQLSDSCADRTP